MSEQSNEPPQETPSSEPAPKSFTQDEVNAMLARQKRDSFGDYGDLKAKAQRLNEFEEQQKTEQQRHADAAAKAQRDAADARAEALRYKAAATHGVGSDYFDLLGTGSEEEVVARAQRVGEFLKLSSENEQIKAELEALRAGRPAPSTTRPTTALKPGATPEDQVTPDAEYAALAAYLNLPTP